MCFKKRYIDRYAVVREWLRLPLRFSSFIWSLVDKLLVKCFWLWWKCNWSYSLNYYFFFRIIKNLILFDFIKIGIFSFHMNLGPSTLIVKVIAHCYSVDFNIAKLLISNLVLIYLFFIYKKGVRMQWRSEGFAFNGKFKFV